MEPPAATDPAATDEGRCDSDESPVQPARQRSADAALRAQQTEKSSSDDETDGREATEPRLFTVLRKADESGVSGTGRVLDGCIFHNGQVVVCWRGDINSQKSGYSSLAIYPCWEAFHKVHIESHPGNETEVIFGHGADLMARLIDRAAEDEFGGPDPGDDEGAEA